MSGASYLPANASVAEDADALGDHVADLRDGIVVAWAATPGSGVLPGGKEGPVVGLGEEGEQEPFCYCWRGDAGGGGKGDLGGGVDGVVVYVVDAGHEDVD